MAIKHPKLGVLVREDGCILLRIKGSKKVHWTPGSLDKYGYRVVNVHRKCYKVHRLVADCFIPNPDNKPTVDHIDRNRQNNVASNLRWASYKEQAENSSNVFERKDYGVRCCEDPKAYRRNYNKDNYPRKCTELARYNASYYKEHREELLAKKREYRQKHRDEINTKRRLAYAARRQGTI